MFLKHPRTGLPDVMLTLSTVVVLAASVKFLLEGINLTIFGHMVNFGHADAMTYGTLLTPVLGAHGYTMTRPNTANPIASQGDSNDVAQT